MMSKTHIAVGVAASLAVVQPATLGGCLAAVLGGALGGDVCDVDHVPTNGVNEALHGHVITTTIVSVVIVVDYLTHAGICDYVAANFGVGTLVGVALFAACGALGYVSGHRTFTHSLLGLALMSQAVWLVCPMLVLPFAVGFASHIALDLLNKKKVQLLFPLTWGSVSLDLCYADGVVNKLLFVVGLCAAVALLAWRLGLSSGVLLS